MTNLSNEIIYIVGAGAHGRVIADVIKDTYPKKKIKFLDDRQGYWDKSINNIKVTGSIDDFLSKKISWGSLIVAIGNNYIRLNILERFNKANTPIISVIHKSAVVFKTASIEPGSMINPQAFIGSNVIIKRGVLINTGAIIEHDSIIEEGVTISSGCKMAGRVTINRAAFICVGVTICPRIKIGEGAIIGAGSVVVNDIPSGKLAYGVPAKVIRPVDMQNDWRRIL